jgi:hypothetical protein
MIRIFAIACAAACLWTTTAFCQATPLSKKDAEPKKDAESSAYCRSAAQALFEGSGDAEVATVWQKCKQGDTIAIAAGAQGAVLQIGRLCDFTKPIVNIGSQVICVLGAERGVR